MTFGGYRKSETSNGAPIDTTYMLKEGVKDYPVTARLSTA
jgi:hypothetical protein